MCQCGTFLRGVLIWRSVGTTHAPSDHDFFRERATRIELAFSAWEADVLPLNYARILFLF